MFYETYAMVTVKGTEAEVLAVTNEMAKVMGDVEIIGQKSFEYCDCKHFTNVDDFEVMALAAAKAAPAAEFIIDGTIDSCGICNIRVEYKNGKVVGMSSDAYTVFDAEQYDNDYDTFIENTESDYSEEEFEQFCDGEWFEMDDGSIVNEVAMGVVFEATIIA